MTRYFFHSIDGQTVQDDEGIEFASADEAIDRATREARILAAESILEMGTLLLDERIKVTDSHGTTVATVYVRDAVTIQP